MKRARNRKGNLIGTAVYLGEFPCNQQNIAGRLPCLRSIIFNNLGFVSFFLLHITVAIVAVVSEDLNDPDKCSIGRKKIDNG